MAQPEILIIGAGPMGLGAAWRLHELEHPRWRVVEATGAPGGAAASVTDAQGFTWSLDGPLGLSGSPYFDACLKSGLGGGLIPHTGTSWVWARGRFIPQPLHRHLDHLPREEREVCEAGLRAAARDPLFDEPPQNFFDWMQRRFGEGLAERFWVPYHTKRWACPPARLGVGWIDPHHAEAETQTRLDVPLPGGPGALWPKVCRRLAPGRFLWGNTVERIDASARRLTLADGSELAYDGLISSMPLQRLVTRVADMPELAPYAERFTWAATHLIGIGLKGALPSWFEGKTWIEIPEDRIAAHRLTVFSRETPGRVPEKGLHWSLLCEVSVSPEHPADPETLAAGTLKDLRRTGLIPAAARIASLWQHRQEYGSATPFYGRDAILDAIQPRLKQHGIFSRGRFGGWKVERSNPVHSWMQGKEAVDCLLLGVSEETYFRSGDLTPRREP